MRPLAVTSANIAKSFEFQAQNFGITEDRITTKFVIWVGLEWMDVRTRQVHFSFLS